MTNVVVLPHECAALSNVRGSLRSVPTRADLVAHIRSIYEARLRKDFDTVLAACHPDICIRIVGNPAASPFFGTRVGRHGVLSAIEAVDNLFEYLDFMIEDILVDGNGIAVRCWLRLKAIQTGVVTELDVFDHFRLSDGLIVEYTQFLDTATIAVGLPQR
jgi:ketosteroid isomerase-like protein